VDHQFNFPFCFGSKGVVVGLSSLMYACVYSDMKRSVAAEAAF
jgi:hypothetical protein